MLIKKLLLSYFLLLLSHLGTAQFEIKGSPFALLFEGASIQVEYTKNQHWGFEGDFFKILEYGYTEFLVKHYFNPKIGADRFHAGVFTGVIFSDTRTQYGLGFMLGYKIITRKNIVFDIGYGLGRAFGSDDIYNFEFVPHNKISLGYRFISKSTKR